MPAVARPTLSVLCSAVRGRMGLRWRKTNASRSTIETATTVSTPRDLSTHDDHVDVDRAPHDGRGALLRNAVVDMVAHRGGQRPEVLSGVRNIHGIATRKVRTALL